MVRTSLLLLGALVTFGCATPQATRAEQKDCVVSQRAVTASRTVTVRDRSVSDPAQQQFIQKTVPVTRMVPVVVCR